MRILVYPHSLDIGGSQLNAIELASAVGTLGHDVSVFGAEPGPLSAMIAALGLQLTLAPPHRRRPSPAIADALRDVCRRDRVDVLHTHEWPPCLEAFYGPLLHDGVTVGCTVMSMSVAPFIPRSVPLVVGTAQIAAAARAGSNRTVDVIEPPVDTTANRPGCGGEAFRARYGLGSRPTLVVVSRLAHALKREGIERAIGAAGILGRAMGLRLVVVGGGEAREALEQAAAQVNAMTGEETVRFTGELGDPRPAYDAADLVLAMGGSALRAMAFAKPVVVLGELGFAEVLTPDSAERFLWQGFYGLGDDLPGSDRLAGLIRPLLLDPERRSALGQFSRSLVESRFSLSAAGQRYATLYQQWKHGRASRIARVRDAIRIAPQLARYKIRRRISRWQGRDNSEDFNTVSEIAKVQSAGQG